jgi:hypothetical protein
VHDYDAKVLILITELPVNWEAYLSSLPETTPHILRFPLRILYGHFAVKF